MSLTQRGVKQRTVGDDQSRGLTNGVRLAFVGDLCRLWATVEPISLTFGRIACNLVHTNRS